MESLLLGSFWVQITKNAFSENNRYNTENISEKNRERDKESILKENLNALAKTFIKFPKIIMDYKPKKY